MIKRAVLPLELESETQKRELFRLTRQLKKTFRRAIGILINRYDSNLDLLNFNDLKSEMIKVKDLKNPLNEVYLDNVCKLALVKFYRNLKNGKDISNKPINLHIFKMIDGFKIDNNKKIIYLPTLNLKYKFKSNEKINELGLSIRSIEGKICATIDSFYYQNNENFY